MIPIRDAIRSKNFPAVNILLIGLNVAAFLLERLGRGDKEGNRGDLFLEVRVLD